MTDAQLEQLVLPLVLATFVLFAMLDFLVPARSFPRVRGWRLRGTLYFAAFIVASITLPSFWDGALGAHRLLDATGLGTGGGIVVGLLAYHFTAYGWHRLMHGSGFLFRWIHQMHHSAERIDVWSAMIFSPWGMVAWTFVSSFALVLLVGLTPRAALIVSLVNTGLALWQHSNLRTPRWLGYLVVRPESHTLHHHRGVHAYNYSDLPFIDMLFGTFRNPTDEQAARPVGFYEGASDRVVDMLLGKDVTRPPGDGASSTPELSSEPT